MKNAGGVANTCQYLLICTAANGISRHQPSALALSGFNLGAGFFKPIRDQIRTARHAIRIRRAQGGGVSIAQFAAHFLIAQKRRIADDDIDHRPSGFLDKEGWQRS